jgi:hypothetical protein
MAAIIDTAGELMHTIIAYSPRTVIASSVLLASLAACNRGSSAGSIDTSAPTSAVTQASVATLDTMTMLRGTVISLQSGQLVVKTDTNAVTVKVAAPLQVYDRAPASLADVKDNTFIGVTTVKQPDGSEQATEIHIFPEALRGLGEGSRMMSPPAGGSASRMTNGNVSASRMSNGTVSSSTGSAFVVQYAGGMQKVVVPANTPVTELKPVSKTLTVGDRVVILANKASDGSLSASQALITK